MPITVQPHRLQVKNNLGQLQYLDAITDRSVTVKLQEIEDLGEDKKQNIINLGEQYQNNINTNGTNILNQIATNGENALSQINNATSDGLSDINATKDDVIIEINNQASVQLNNITEDLNAQSATIIDNFLSKQDTIINTINNEEAEAITNINNKENIAVSNVNSKLAQYSTTYELTQMIALAFDTQKHYAIGEYVTYPGQNGYNKLYKFISSHEPGGWDETQVKEITFTDEMNVYFPNIYKDILHVAAEVHLNAQNLYRYVESISELMLKRTDDVEYKLISKLEKVDFTNLIINLQEKEKEFNLKLSALANKNELGAAVVPLEQDIIIIQNNIKKIQELIPYFANKNDVGSFFNQLITLQQMINTIDKKFNHFSTKQEVGSSISTIDNELVDVNQQLIKKTDLADSANLYYELDKMRLDQVDQQNTITSLLGKDAERITQINQKITKPTNSPNGLLGQVLQSNGDGSTTWVNPTNSPTNQQVNGAIESWFLEHPDATTLVNDGSITLQKLSDNVQEMLNNGQLGGDTAVFIDGVNLNHQFDHFSSGVFHYKFNLINAYKEKLYTYANRFINKGLGFLFFTDPHSASSEIYGNTEYELLKQLNDIKIIFQNTPAKYVLCGGDWLNMNHSKYQAMRLIGRINNLLKSEIGNQCFTVCGNHDTNTERPLTSSDMIEQEELNRMWFGTEVGYYIIEGYDHNIFMFDSGPITRKSLYENENDYDITQLLWLGTQLEQNQKPHLLGVIHSINKNNSDEAPSWFGSTATKIIQAFNHKQNYTFTYTYSGNSTVSRTFNFSSNTVGTFHFIISGHHHRDDYFIKDDIPVIRTYDCKNYLLLDCCYADFNNGKLYLDRIGGIKETISDNEIEDKTKSRQVAIIATGNSTINN